MHYPASFSGGSVIEKGNLTGNGGTMHGVFTVPEVQTHSKSKKQQLSQYSLKSVRRKQYHSSKGAGRNYIKCREKCQTA